MKNKRSHIQRIIYQLGDLADEHTPMSEVDYDDLIDQWLNMKDHHYALIIKDLQQEYEAERDKYFCYLLLREVYMNSFEYHKLADLTYHPSPDNLWSITNIFNSIPIYTIDKIIIRDLSGLIRACKHEDPFIRVHTVNFLRHIDGKKGMAYLIKHLCIAQSFPEIMQLLHLLDKEPVVDGAAGIICFLHRLNYIDNRPLYKVIDYLNDSSSVATNCGPEFMRSIQYFRNISMDFYYHALVALSVQDPFPHAAIIAKEHLKNAEYQGPALICLLKHSQPRELISNFELFKQLLAAGQLHIEYPEYEFDPILQGFLYFKKYINRYPEIRDLYHEYTTTKSTVLSVDQLESLIELTEDF